MTDTDLPFERLRLRCGEAWPHVTAARARTAAALARMQPLQDVAGETTSIVVFGSLGRAEVTTASDVDWTLLIDGPSDPEHYRQAHEVARQIDELAFRKPGETNTFGTLVSSHELIHNIAGTSDTNQNLTRRILLLLESRAVTNPEVRERVLRNVLDRYIVYDPPVGSRGWGETVPQFLLNDVVRYWRTMAADFASKMWERQQRGWGIRNAKLRFSRKLLFASGLLTCFMWSLFPPDDVDRITSYDELAPRLTEYILEQTRLSPIDVVAKVLLAKELYDTARQVIGAYDAFLGIIADADNRRILEKLDRDAAVDDPVFAKVREITRPFREGILQLFFDDDPALAGFMRKFGVF
jgi:predicted nucleotidyltransferase